jgi:hypothetical protein
MKMQTFRKPHQWLSFWLEKYIEVLTGLKYDGEKRKQYWLVLKTFLEELPGNPRNITLSAIKTFIATDPDERLLPITIFYQHIAPSRPHLDMLKKFDASDPMHTEQHVDGPVDKFEAQLLQQQLSDRTIRNYCAAVSGYLKWNEEKGICAHIGNIDEYCTFLATVKQLAPRTVSMHHSALKLFYTGFSPDQSSQNKQ